MHLLSLAANEQAAALDHMSKFQLKLLSAVTARPAAE